MRVGQGIAGQIAAGFAVPVVALVAATIAVVAGFAQMADAKRHVVDTALLQTRVADIRVQIARQRESVSAFALTRKGAAFAAYHEAGM